MNLLHAVAGLSRRGFNFTEQARRGRAMQSQDCQCVAG